MLEKNKIADKQSTDKLAGRISLEKISHFRCGKCNRWWSVADAPRRETWFCPWCGVKQKIINNK
ncbi:MAG: hypothetical protein V1856_00615 [Candidatus Liptonbacteria bacterium]